MANNICFGAQSQDKTTNDSIALLANKQNSFVKSYSLTGNDYTGYIETSVSTPSSYDGISFFIAWIITGRVIVSGLVSAGSGTVRVLHIQNPNTGNTLGTVLEATSNGSHQVEYGCFDSLINYIQISTSGSTRFRITLNLQIQSRIYGVLI